MDVSVVTPPLKADILKIVSVAQLKAQLRVTNTQEDAIAEASILAAYDWLANPVNGWLNRALITTTLKATLPGWVKPEVYSSTETGGPAVKYVPASVIELPMPPLQSVSGITYLADEVEETLAPADYVVARNGAFGKIWRATGATWPTVDVHPESVAITFIAGYGDGDATRDACPGIVQAIKLLAADAFRNREDTYAEPRLVAVNRKIMNGVQFYAGRYRFMNRYA